jgi:signal peptidase I
MSLFDRLRQYRLRRRRLSEVRDFYRFFRRQRLYLQHRWSEKQNLEALAYEEELGLALREKDLGRMSALVARGEKLLDRLFPPVRWPRLKDNVEVAFVAVTVALAIRTYFVQPFKIPTDSMKPTLYGIQVLPGPEHPPPLVQRVWERVVFGRSYQQVTLEKGGTLTDMREGGWSPWFEYTDLLWDSGERKRLWVPIHVLVSKAGISPGVSFPSGTRLSFVLQTGDQVLVNKWIYYFRQPQRGDPFVFKTTGIEGIEARLKERGIEGSQYYIKRCVGLPGDRLSLDPPYLLINGSRRPPHPKMAEIEERRDGYQGYVVLSGQNFLRSPQETVLLPPKAYWAMGDNSPDSLDSRFWGPVPKKNIVGVAFWVYWPFSPRWGWVR